MKSCKDRRGFLTVLGLGGIAGALGSQAAHAKSIEGGATYKGVSKKGSLEEALQDAINQAAAAAPGADRMVEWTLKTISGRQGGFAGFNELQVEIEASV